MENEQPNNPLHGISLKAMLEDLVERRGWEDLGGRIRVRCFSENPSIASSLKFLRKTDWARLKVEQLYLEDCQSAERNRKRNQRRAAMRAFRAESESRDSEKDGTENSGAENQEAENVGADAHQPTKNETTAVESSDLESAAANTTPDK